MKFFAVLFCVFGFVFVSGCGELNFSGGKKDRDRRGGEDLDLDFDPKEIYKALGDTQNCSEYEGGYNSFRLSSAFGDTPFSDMENCLSLALDKSVGVICKQEKKLKALKRKHKNDDDALDQIEEAESNLEYLKEDVVDQLYTMADIFDAVELDLEDEIDEAFDNDNSGHILAGGFLKMLVRSEVGGFTKFFEHKAKALCGYNIFASSDDDGDED